VNLIAQIRKGTTAMDKSKITQLLQAHSSGDTEALDLLMPLVYDQMKDGS